MDRIVQEGEDGTLGIKRFGKWKFIAMAIYTWPNLTEFLNERSWKLMQVKAKLCNAQRVVGLKRWTNPEAKIQCCQCSKKR